MRSLIRWFVEQAREVNRANAVMRVPELRARYTGPELVGGVRRRSGADGGGIGCRCVRLQEGSVR